MSSELSETRERISKRLSFVLRHDPGSIDIALDREGWIEVNLLVHALNGNGFAVDLSAIADVVASTPKKRFELVDGRIRAAQGHSISVDLAHDLLTHLRFSFMERSRNISLAFVSQG